MPRTDPAYAPDYRRRIIELARTGRPLAQLAGALEASANAIRKWVKPAGLDEALRRDGLTTAEREELNRLRREHRVLREERGILSKLTSRPGPGFLTWRWCSTLSAAEASAGRWKPLCAPNWCCKLLKLALWQRRPAAVIHHSDQGSQYTSLAFGRRCREAGVRPSMGSVGDWFDNAMCASFFATLECELRDRHCFKTQVEARMAVFEFIEGWYNPHRRHAALDYLSPINYQRIQQTESLTASPIPSIEAG